MITSRKEAGMLLSKKLAKFKGKNVIVLAIPRGGVPVAYNIAKELDAKLDLIIPRKLPIPYEPEAGFGAVINSTVVLNKKLLAALDLTRNEITKIIKDVQKEVKRRIKKYRGKKPFPNLKGKTVIIVDDGLASGYTMLAAIKYIKEKAKKVVVAVPVASLSAAIEVKPKVDEFICLMLSSEPVFAVASFYKDFPDLTDNEVINYLKKME